MPVLVDNMQNEADIAFKGWPERIYVLDSQSKIIYQGGKGPYGFSLDELRQFLDANL